MKRLNKMNRKAMVMAAKKFRDVGLPIGEAIFRVFTESFMRQLWYKNDIRYREVEHAKLCHNNEIGCDGSCIE